MKRRNRQLGLDLAPRTWGGKRAGAGRKPTGKRRDPLHRVRPEHVGRHPVHIVLRVRREVGRLRRPDVYDALHAALAVVAARVAFRVVHASLQHNHLHLLVEAADKPALASGMRGLAISLARRINAARGRTGKVFEFRYHATALTTPRQTRHALAYVLNNWRRHREDERELHARTAVLDPYSSAIRFADWHDFQLETWPAGYRALPVCAPQTWLLATGWRRARVPIRTDEVPGPVATA